DVVIGDGATLYAEVIARAANGARVIEALPLAGAIGRLAVARAARGELVDPSAIQPVYVRRPDAEIARDGARPETASHAWPIQQLTSPDEIDEVLRIEQASFTSPWTREMYLSELANRGVSYCFVAKDAAGAAVGFCSVWRVLDELHINNLAVLPEKRRRGAASALLTHGLAVGAKPGAQRATLEGRTRHH